MVVTSQTLPGNSGVGEITDRKFGDWLRHHRRQLGNLLSFVVLSLGLVFVFLPIFWLLETAFKKPLVAFAVPPHFLFTPTLQNFSELIHSQFISDVGHSAILTGMSTAVALILGLPASYAFSRATFVGKRFVSGWLIIAYIMPAVALMLPLYAMYAQIGLSGSFVSMMLFYETGLLPFVIFLMRGYFTDLPLELDEAARIDGCSRFQAFWRVVLPSVLPGIATVTILVAVACWGEYFGALVLSDPSTQTAPVAIDTYIGLTSSNWSAMAAGGLFVVIPVIAFVSVVQRGFMRGLARLG
jgi:multiple sugar transport system permease protein